MQKRAIVVLGIAVTLAVASRPADAGCGGRCPKWVEYPAYVLLAGFVGGYLYGTGYYLYNDLAHDPEDGLQSREYVVGEITFNTLLATAWGAGTVASARDGRVGATLAYGSLAALHTTLALHGVGTAYEYRGPFELEVSAEALGWAARIGYVGNTLVWTAMLPGRHGRTYGIVEAAVNAPIAAGLGYLAIERFRHDDGGTGFLYGGLAVLSGAFAYHGVRLAIDPPEPPGLDLLGTDVTPSVVSDGHEFAPGLVAAGTW